MRQHYKIRFIILFCFAFIAFQQVAMGQWEQMSGPKSDNIYCIAKRDSIIYAGGFFGLYKLNNQNHSLNVINNGLPVTQDWLFYITAIELLDSSILIGTSNGGFFKLFNNTWAPADSGLYIDSLGFPFINDIFKLNDTIIASTANGIYYTSDEGATWNHSSNFIHPCFEFDCAI